MAPGRLTQASRGGGRSANSKLALLTLAILATTIVWAFTNPSLGKVKFVYAVADCAQ